MATTTKFFSDGKVLKAVGQYDAVADLPDATNLDDDVLAWVVAEDSYYQVASGAWVAASGIGGDMTKATYDPNDDGIFAVAQGGTGASTAGVARTNLGVEIGTNVQAYAANLDDFAGKDAPTGDVVGTTDTQTLTGKTISGTMQYFKWQTATQAWDGASDAIPIGTANYTKVTISADVSPTFTGTIGGSSEVTFTTLRIAQDAAGGWGVTWPASVTWVDGDAPDVAGMGPNEIGFVYLETYDGGTVWYGYHTLPDYQEVLEFALSNESSSLTTGTKFTWRAPYALTVEDVRASVTTAPTGSNLIVDVNEGGVSIFSTRLSIDAGEKTSTTAATAAVISDAAIADDAEVTFDVDQVGSTTAGAGLKVKLYVSRA